MALNVAVIYYSSTGTIYQLAKAASEAAEKAGAEVRLRQVAELAPPEAVASRPEWGEHLEATKDVPQAQLDDLQWAEVLLFGTPTRFGNVAAQLKQFLDSAGMMWMQGQLADKVVGGFTGASTPHGGHEATLLALYNTIHHWGGVIVPAGYATPELWEAGNPYGVSTFAAMGAPAPSEQELNAIRSYAARVIKVGSALAAAKQEVPA